MSAAIRLNLGRSNSELWVGVDLGTQSVTCVIVDGSGTRYGEATVSPTGVRDGVRHEQDPAAWGSATRSAMARAIAGLGENMAASIRAVAAWSTGGTLAAALAALNIDPALLPEVVDPGTVIGESSEEWQRRTGLPAGTMIVAGPLEDAYARFTAALGAERKTKEQS